MLALHSLNATDQTPGHALSAAVGALESSLWATPGGKGASHPPKTIPRRPDVNEAGKAHGIIKVVPPPEWMAQQTVFDPADPSTLPGA